MAYNFLACDRDQAFLLPPEVREWLPVDHMAWFALDIDQLAYLVAGCCDPAGLLVVWGWRGWGDLTHHRGGVGVAPQVGELVAHQATSWQTGQRRRAARRSQRAWLRALASRKPQLRQEATQRPASRCSAGGSPSSPGLASAGWVLAWVGSQWWWVIAAAAAHGSGQLTAS
jgi:hypothetical protein